MTNFEKLASFVSKRKVDSGVGIYGLQVETSEAGALVSLKIIAVGKDVEHYFDDYRVIGVFSYDIETASAKLLDDLKFKDMQATPDKSDLDWFESKRNEDSEAFYTASGIYD